MSDALLPSGLDAEPKLEDSKPAPGLGSETDDRSSSLSDVEDRMGNEMMDPISTDSKHDADAEESEAETERLEESPQKSRKHKTIILQTSKRDVKGDPPTPEQLNYTENMIDLPKSDFVGSLQTNGVGFEDGPIDPTSDISSLADSATEISRPVSSTSKGSRKRKRQSSGDPSESEHDITAESLKEVTVHLANHANHVAEQEIHEELAPPMVRAYSDQMDEEHGASDPDGPDSFSKNLQIPTAQKARLRTRNGNKANGKNLEVSTSGAGTSVLEQALVEEDGVEATLSNGEDAEMGDTFGNDAGVAARNEEELAKKRSAMDSLSAIEQCFAHLRDKLFDDRLSQLNEELTLLNQPNCQHPEYLAMMESVDQRRDEKIEYEQTLLRYKLEALERRSVGERAIQHSQYMQTARDIRDNILEQIGKEWYQIQRGRRSYDEDKLKYTYKYPTRRSQQITQQAAYNTEVSILSGVAKYVGFPAAPELIGARPDEIDDDLKKMGITPNTIHRLPLQSFRATPSLSMLTRSKPAAEEQFLEQTPWANPQHPAHQQNPGAVNRRILHSSRPHSPYATPPAQRRPAVGLGSASTIVDQHSDPLVAPTPSTAEQASATYHAVLHEPLTSQTSVIGTQDNTSKTQTSADGPDKQDIQREPSPLIVSLPLERATSLGQPRDLPEIPERRRTSSPLVMRSPRLTASSQFVVFGPHLEETLRQARSSSVHIEGQMPQQVGIS